MISYISTRGGGEPRSFKDVLMSGLAPDGGLYVPEKWPHLSIETLKGKSYNEIAEAVIFPFVEGSADPHNDRLTLREYIYEVYNNDRFPGGIAPIKEIYPGLHILELFHGPTIAFKDVALQLLGRFFEFEALNHKTGITIVGATSGDTGSAAIEGCRQAQGMDGEPAINIFILHPRGRVSDVQRRQMTTVDAANVHNIAIEGTFDDCQNLVKAMFGDAAFRTRMNLTAVNSINWARIMAQIVYYVAASLQIPGATFVVPTGNFGNVFAAYAARKMGAPLGNLCIATNKNDILTRFFETGEMKIEGTHATISPSMDIQVSSNFERYLFDLLDRNAAKLAALMQQFKKTGQFSLPEELMLRARAEFLAMRCDEQNTADTMKKVYQETGYLLDPHSAVGVAAGLQMISRGKRPVISLATAHPAKFPDAVENATGQRPPLPRHLAHLFEKEERFTVLPNDLATVQDFIEHTRQGHVER